jgi:hypothetical protein
LHFAFFALLSTAAAGCMADATGTLPELWPAQGCTVGDVRHTAQEKWVASRGFGKAAEPAEQVYTGFDDNGPASALRFAMSAPVLGNVARVEVEDAQGKWETVWSGRYSDAQPAGCADVWFEHSLAGAPRLVNAIRLSFVLDRMPMAVGRVQLRRVE